MQCFAGRNAAWLTNKAVASLTAWIFGSDMTSEVCDSVK